MANGHGGVNSSGNRDSCILTSTDRCLCCTILQSRVPVPIARLRVCVEDSKSHGLDMPSSSTSKCGPIYSRLQNYKRFALESIQPSCCKTEGSTSSITNVMNCSTASILSSAMWCDHGLSTRSFANLGLTHIIPRLNYSPFDKFESDSGFAFTGSAQLLDFSFDEAPQYWYSADLVDFAVAISGTVYYGQILV
jgi:hypothetical protein